MNGLTREAVNAQRARQDVRGELTQGVEELEQQREAGWVAAPHCRHCGRGLQTLAQLMHQGTGQVLTISGNTDTEGARKGQAVGNKRL